MFNSTLNTQAAKAKIKLFPAPERFPAARKRDDERADWPERRERKRPPREADGPGSERNQQRSPGDDGFRTEDGWRGARPGDGAFRRHGRSDAHLGDGQMRMMPIPTGFDLSYYPEGGGAERKPAEMPAARQPQSPNAHAGGDNFRYTAFLRKFSSWFATGWDFHFRGPQPRYRGRDPALCAAGRSHRR